MDIPAERETPEDGGDRDLALGELNRTSTGPKRGCMIHKKGQRVKEKHRRPTLRTEPGQSHGLN